MEYESLLSHLERRSGAEPREVAYIVDDCTPLDAIDWPYPGKYDGLTVGMVLRRFRDPILVIRAVLWALRLAIFWEWRRDRLSPEVLEAWNNFIAQVEAEEPFPQGYSAEFFEVVLDTEDESLGGRTTGTSIGATIFYLMRGVNRMSSPQYRTIDEEDYYGLGRAIVDMFREIRYRPAVLPEWGVHSHADRAVLRWWEILQCVMPIRNVFGPPLIIGEITSSADEFVWEDEVLQAVAGMLENTFEDMVHVTKEAVPVNWQAGEYWRAYVVGEDNVSVFIEVTARYEAAEAPDIEDITINVEVSEVDTGFGASYMFLEQTFEFPLSEHVDEVARVIGNAINDAIENRPR